jgi:integrase
MDIHPDLRAYLVKLKAEQERMQSVCGDSYEDTDGKVTHVCVWPNGKPLAPDHVTRHFRLLLKKNALPQITFHELRHTCGSLLLNAGANIKQVQEYLGHEDVSTTLSIYTHLTKDKKTESSNLLGGLLSL